MNFISKFFLDQYVKRLANISKRYKHRDGNGFLTPEGEKESRKIGEEIYARWGHEGMVYVCETIGKKLSSVHARELEVAWNRIGRWRR